VPSAGRALDQHACDAAGQGIAYYDGRGRPCEESGDRAGDRASTQQCVASDRRDMKRREQVPQVPAAESVQQR